MSLEILRNKHQKEEKRIIIGGTNGKISEFLEGELERVEFLLDNGSSNIFRESLNKLGKKLIKISSERLTGRVVSDISYFISGYYEIIRSANENIEGYASKQEFISFPLTQIQKDYDEFLDSRGIKSGKLSDVKGNRYALLLSGTKLLAFADPERDDGIFNNFHLWMNVQHKTEFFLVRSVRKLDGTHYYSYYLGDFVKKPRFTDGESPWSFEIDKSKFLQKEEIPISTTLLENKERELLLLDPLKR